MILKSKEEVELIRQSALLVSETLGMIASEIRDGVTGIYLDKLAEKFIRDHGGIPGFLGKYDFPFTLCISPNEQVVHGFPSDKPFESGDIVSVDCGVLMNGYYGDQAYTFPIGDVDEKTQKLLDVTKTSLYLGIEAFCVGNCLGDVGYAIQQYTESQGYGVVRKLVGHGIGKSLHEAPEVPNYGIKGLGKKIREGLVVAIEPMINMGTHRIKQLKDGWTIITSDKKYSAHFEHDIAIVDGVPEVLSSFKYIHKALGISDDREDRFRQKALEV